MNGTVKSFRHWRSALTGAVLCIGVGLSLLWFWPRGWPVVLSYDLLFLVREQTPPDEVVIVYMDDQSFRDFGQDTTPNWDRNLHANLVDHLTAEGARLVVFDVVFSERGEPQANANFARAIRENGKVVLAAALNYPSRAQIFSAQPLLPLPEFLTVAAGWGMAELDVDSTPGRVARQYFAGTEHQPGLPQVAAIAAGGIKTLPSPEESPAWLNYYGAPRTLPYFTYNNVSNQPAGSFSNKYVFVGALPTTLKAQDEADQFRTPYTHWTGDYSPGVEIGATAFLNLIRDDALKRMAGWGEWMLVVSCGLLLGGALSVLRPVWSVMVAMLCVVAMVMVAVQAARNHIWFPWTLVAFAQIPVALGWSLRCHFHRMKFEKEVLERTLVETSRFTEAAAAKAKEAGLVIPDHELVRCVGRGAYGEVWLARNAIGVFHAVKIVQRRAFPADEPYEREFKGIQKFMPISRSHPGFVNVLHVGRNNDAGYFFYIMEPADDQAAGQKIDPESYSPKTLATELNWRGKLAPEECLTVGIALSLALEHLHRQQLIHRDIKPGNIIYVNDIPKFADIGLVTEQRSEGREVSLVGTEGYIPPEGPGTPSADVFALGKVLYEVAMGRDRMLFPEVPTAVWEEADDSLLRRLNEVIGRACASNAGERYASAKELHEALVGLQSG